MDRVAIIAGVVLVRVCGITCEEKMMEKVTKVMETVMEKVTKVMEKGTK